MAKLCVFLQKRPEVSTDAFRQWWGRHVKTSSQMPGLQGYRINFVNEIRPFGIEQAVVEYDGTAQLWFGEGGLEQAFSSSVGKEAVEDADNVCQRRVEFVTEEHVILEGPEANVAKTLKLVVMMRRIPEMTAKEFGQWWLEHVKLSSQIPGLMGYRINLVQDVMGSGFQKDDVAFDGTAELWFRSVSDMDEGFGSPLGQRAADDAVSHCSARVRFLTEEHIVI